MSLEIFTSKSGIQYTNRYNLPPEICSAVLMDRYTDKEDMPCDYSVSNIVAPIQQTILKKRHKGKHAIRDVIDYYWSFKGSVALQILEDSFNETMGDKF